MEGYLGQVHRSRSENVHWDVPLTSACSESLVYGPAKEQTQEYDVGCFLSVCGFVIYIMSRITPDAD